MYICPAFIEYMIYGLSNVMPLIKVAVQSCKYSILMYIMSLRSAVDGI